MNIIFKKLPSLPKALSLSLCMALTTPVIAADDDAFTTSAMDYRAQSSMFSGMGDRTRQLVESTMQNLRVFNQGLARSMDRTDFRMSAMDLPAPDNWDYEYWDYVNQTKSFVSPTSDGVMFEIEIKYR